MLFFFNQANRNIIIQSLRHPVNLFLFAQKGSCSIFASVDSCSSTLLCKNTSAVHQYYTDVILPPFIGNENILDIFRFTWSVATALRYLYNWFTYSLSHNRISSDRRSIEPHNSTWKQIVSKLFSKVCLEWIGFLHSTRTSEVSLFPKVYVHRTDSSGWSLLWAVDWDVLLQMDVLLLCQRIPQITTTALGVLDTLRILQEGDKFELQHPHFAEQ